MNCLPKSRRPTREQLYELYVVQGLGLRGTAAALGVSPNFVCKELKVLGIKARPQMKHPTLQRDFFDCIDTPEKAYALGLFWSDGSIDQGTQQARIRLAVSDREVLEKLRQIMGAGPLLEIPMTGLMKQAQAGLVLSSKQIVDALVRLGLTHGKDNSLPAALPIPTHLRRDMVRGLIDGDGCLCFTSGTPRISFRNRNASLRDVVSNYWFEITGENASLDGITLDKGTGRIYPSVYLCSKASVLAASILYTPGDISIPRKYKIAQSWRDRVE